MTHNIDTNRRRGILILIEILEKFLVNIYFIIQQENNNKQKKNLVEEEMSMLCDTSRINRNN